MDGDILKQRYYAYYEKNSPQDVAETILGINLEDGYNPKAVLSELDRKFKENFKELLGWNNCQKSVL